MSKPCPHCGKFDIPPCDHCADCGVELTRVFPEHPAKQYDNALEIKLSGGYGMFFDNIDGDHHVFLCHDCAHRACLVLNWLNKLIQPEHSHAHTAEFWEFNNGHLGWDKPRRRQKSMSRRSCFNDQHHHPHTKEELREDVFQFTAELNADIGIDLNPQDVWDNCLQKLTIPDE